MIFQRNPLHVNYFLPTDAGKDLKFFIFSKKDIAAFSLDDALAGKYPESYLLIFYKLTIDYSDNARQSLLSALSANDMILWLDDNFTAGAIGSASAISISNKNRLGTGGINIVIGTNNNKIGVGNNDTEGAIRYDAANNKLVLVPAAGNSFSVIAHGKASGTGEIDIPLSNTDKVLTGHQFSQSNNFGAACFRVLKADTGDLPQPLSPYFADAKVFPDNPRTIANFYFDIPSYNGNVELYASFKPFQVVPNDPDAFSSYFESVFKDNTHTNLIDEIGAKYRVTGSKDGSSKLVSRIAAIEYNPGHADTKDYFFIPQTGQSLALVPQNNLSSRLLTGFSGTESIAINDSTRVFQFRFHEVGTVNIDKDTGTLITNGDSKTSFIKIDSTTYNLDAEKLPLFENTRAESPYIPIPNGTIPQDTPLPILPTLSFINNPDLQELEKVCAKIRLNAARQASPTARAFDTDKAYITPQGFLKTGAARRYDFISTASQPDEFALIGIESQLESSLRKDQVFFVLTPKLFAQYLQNTTIQTKISARFSINKPTADGPKFTVDVSGLFPVPLPAGIDPSKFDHDKCIVIFKFHKGKLIDLLQDTSQWSNQEGKLGDRTELGKISDAIKKLDITNINDTYFTQTILTDDNWNGMVILNIPVMTPDSLPTIFAGLTASQNLQSGDASKPLKLTTGMAFRYVAFPLNKTYINKDGGAVSVAIRSTSFYGLIDYDILKDRGPGSDYKQVSDYFPAEETDIKRYEFALTKLFVRFENSQIRDFNSYVFLQIPQLFDNNISIAKIPLTHPDNPAGDQKSNLIRLNGSYQKNGAGKDEFNFGVETDLEIGFGNGSILQKITVNKLGFSYSDGGENEYRFDMDAKVYFSNTIQDLGKDLGNLFSFDLGGLDFQNIGIAFDKNDLSGIHFDFSKLLVLPNISFNGNGLLSSFPIRFSNFQGFKLDLGGSPGNWTLQFPKNDFLKIHFKAPNINLGLPKITIPNLFSFIFDFDLGTLGNLGGLKNLKGQLLLGWSLNGGFALGFKLDGPGAGGLHIDLFGALKLDIQEVNLVRFSPQTGAPCTAHFLRLNNVRLTFFGTPIPKKEDTFNGIIIADFTKGSKKTAWLINLDDNVADKLILGIGQRMGPPVEEIKSTVDALKKVRSAFTMQLNGKPDCSLTATDLQYAPDRNWLVGSEDIISLISDQWSKTLDLRFIFNDPVLYGLYLGFKGNFLTGFSIDILYKKISENLGVYSTDLQLPDNLRSYDTGAVFFRLPNIGIAVYTNGDWKVDIGFPATSDDWSRSGYIQLRTAPPFVGWFGFYIMQSKVASLTLFKGYITDTYSQARLNIIQAGFAMRVGIGAYIDEGIFYAGASISVYGIMEGAFAFEKEDTGLAKLFPDHFALFGRVGAIAELVGYVDFSIIKASVYISLRAEFGFLLVYLSKDGSVLNPGRNQKKGIQPVKVYIEGQVTVRITIKIGCIEISLNFGAFVRFEYVIGGDGSSGNARMARRITARTLDLSDERQLAVPVTSITNIPMAYLPAFSRTNEDGKTEKLFLVHSFIIPLFGCQVKEKVIQPTVNNILKDKIIGPFFRDVLKIISLPDNKIANPTTYETLRSILLTGKCQDTDGKGVKIDIQLPDYRPTLINGINTSSDSEIRTMLKNPDLFSFKDGEIKPCTTPGNCDPIATAYLDEMLLIPAPVSKKIQVVTRDYDSKDPHPLYISDNGFNIDIEGLVTDEAGNPGIHSIIDKIDKTSSDIDWITTFFDDYKSQFVSRKNDNAARKEDLTLDLRGDVIIPEFFKLVGLLTLDAFYNSLPKDKKGEGLDPSITNIDATGLFTYQYTTKDDKGNDKIVNGTWNPNSALPDIVGQLNYFYNSGLRFPGSNQSVTTQSIYDILGQKAPVKALTTPIGARDPSTVKVTLGTQPITADVFGTPANVTDMWTFIDKFGAGFSLSDLRKEFDPSDQIKFVRPFKLKPVTLAVSTGKLSVMDGGILQSRFFEWPKKLAAHGGPDSLYSFQLNYADNEHQDAGHNDIIEYSTAPLDPAVHTLSGISECLNIEMQVKYHDHGVLEIVNVHIEDLNLMNLLYKHIHSYPILSIDFFYKPSPDPASPNADIPLLRLITAFASVLKTNLSPRTAPPIFDLADARLRTTATKDLAGNVYWEDSNKDTANFIRLTWEALTTNNGGYFIILDKPIPAGSPLTTAAGNQTIIVSFKGAQDNVPAYFNTIRMDLDDTNRGVSDGLTAKTHYLYLDRIILNGKNVREYHPTIPAHTCGFEIARDRRVNPARNYSNYLPLEFNVAEEAIAEDILNKEKILPIMPTSALDAGGNPLPDQYKYRHISPLTTLVRSGRTDDPNNILRYGTVGKKYTLSINLRDTFGFRTNKDGEFLASKEYTHFYFDKLIPFDSWPLIKFSWWFLQKDKPTGNLLFSLTAEWKMADVATLDPDSIEGILNNLYTIAAQLTDDRTRVQMDNYTETTPNEIKKLLLSQVTSLILQLTGQPDPKPVRKIPFTLRVIPPVNIKALLQFTMTISRPDANLLNTDNAGAQFQFDNKELIGGNPWIWEFQTTFRCQSIVKAQNPDEINSSKLADLNNAIRSETKYKELRNAANQVIGFLADYSLGVSSDEKTNQKQVFLVNEQALSGIKATNTSPTGEFDEIKCYYGIKPFSNQLWSGIYQPADGTLPRSSFSNIDLDRSLRIVLAKMDELLLPNSIASAFPTEKTLYESLIASKRSMANDQLKDQVDWVMDNITKPPPGPALIDGFRDLLLAGLNNFYDYDGAISTNITGIDLSGHRLSLGLETQQGYNLVSSKLGNGTTGWYIFFDQKDEVTSDISFDVVPSVTHIEFGIRPIDGSDIEESTWIQLLTPAKIDIDKYTVTKWPKIIREFPDKPLIVQHAAIQRNDNLGDGWDIGKAGRWYYELSIKDTYKLNDTIKVDLMIQTSGSGARIAGPAKDIKGFIAYWAANILTADSSKDWANRKDFIMDLAGQFVANASGTTRLAEAGGVSYSFGLTKTGIDPVQWKIADPNTIPGVTITFNDGKGGSPDITIGDFDIFTKDNNRVISILPRVTVLRNREVNNPGFFYQTESIQPANPATPHIRYFIPIPLQNTIDAFDKLVFVPLPGLPFKATAKYLVDTALDDFPGNTRVLPSIPVQQIECEALSKPTKTDTLFDNFDKNNGYQAFSLTVYNATKVDAAETGATAQDDLPVFFADTIFKKIKP